MRILQIAPLWEDVPPPAYGGTEAVVSLLTEELVARGHDVTLAASGASKTSARLFSTYYRSLRRADDLKDRNPYDWTHIARAIEIAREFDIVHNHAGELAMAMAPLAHAPMLTTMHCLITPDTQFIWDRYRGAYNTISRSQARHLPKVVGPARYVGYAHNAVDVDSFPFQAEKRDDLLFLSRVAPEKGPHLAVEVAKRLGMRLIIAGKVDRYDRDFFEEVMRELIDGEQIVFYGEADAAQKRELYRSVRCLLLPLCWDEPFGLVMPEAMACGTPVVALRRGAVEEIVVHGETGFICDSLDEMVEAVRATRSIDPARCRAHVAANFSPQRMADAYLELYAKVLDGAAVADAPILTAQAPSGNGDGKPLAVA
jgi:glycosyltransferase involved in cell wall biosynthesis